MIARKRMRRRTDVELGSVSGRRTIGRNGEKV